MSHSPLPWVDLGSAIGIAYKGQATEADQLIEIAIKPHPADWDKDEWNANAAYIVQCCNSHEALVAALEGLIHAIEDEIDDYPAQDAAIEIARAALAMARGD